MLRMEDFVYEINNLNTNGTSHQNYYVFAVLVIWGHVLFGRNKKLFARILAEKKTVVPEKVFKKIKNKNKRRTRDCSITVHNDSIFLNSFYPVLIVLVRIVLYNFNTTIINEYTLFLRRS